MMKSYPNGHMSVFQSTITNTRKVQFSKNTNPCMFNHTKIRQFLNDLGYNIWFTVFDRIDGYLWFRHPNASTYKPFKKNENTIYLSD